MLTDLQNEILKLKKENDVAILAHCYQQPEILEIADVVGDSFMLATAAQKLDNRNVVMCGVRFMGETVKILSPEKNVVMPVKNATCPMAEQITPKEIIKFKEKNPIFKIVSYVNTTAEIKAVSDVCVTSSCALKIVEKIKEPVLFVPDKNLGSYIKSQLHTKDIILMHGCCPVHNSVTVDDVKAAKELYPDMPIAMHPEVQQEVLQYADFAGSTTEIMDYCERVGTDVIIGTEKSICDHMSLKHPDRRYPLLSKCLICPDMKLITLGDVYKAVKGNGYAIELDEEIRIKAKNAIDKMIEMNNA